MSSVGNLHLLQLVPFARQLSEANEVLLDRESILRQLSLLKLFSELVTTKTTSSNNIRNNGSTLIDELFKIEWKIVPGLNSMESLLITIGNLSEIFEFDENYWSLSISFGNGNVHVWNFMKRFKFGSAERFSIEYLPEFQSFYGPGGRPPKIREKIDVNLVFAIQWTGVNYVRNFSLKSFYVDILHFVNPGRRPPLVSFQCSSAITKTVVNGDLLYTSKYPAVSKFNVRVDKKIQEVFVEKIFLRDSFHTRGFAQENENSRSDLIKNSKEFHSYYYNDKIICSKDEVNNLISIHCTNPRVLHLVKDAVYTRLIDLCESRLVRIKYDTENYSDGECSVGDLLYNVKLQLECLVMNPSTDFPQLLEIYFKFREVSESVLSFVYSNG